MGVCVSPMDIRLCRLGWQSLLVLLVHLLSVVCVTGTSPALDANKETQHTSQRRDMAL